MTTTYGAPTGLDLSSCSVTATGSTAAQTLGDLSKNVADNASGVATAIANASTAQTTATQASSDVANALAIATAAQISATAAQTTANAAIPTSAYQNANGPAQYDASGLTYQIFPAITGMPQVAVGRVGAETEPVILKFFAGGTSTDSNNGFDATIFCLGGTSKGDGNLTVTANMWGSQNDGGTALGGASNRWNGVFSNSGTIQTSDANEKTVVGVIGSTSYTDSAKLVSAAKAIRKAITVFTFNDGGTRKHVGAIAQQVEQALSDAGLTPSDFGIWCQDALTKSVEVRDENGVLTSVKTEPALDAHGNQIYRQSLRYDELSMLLIAVGEAEAQENAAALAALTTRVAALEAKAGA